MNMNLGGGIEELLSSLKQRLEMIQDENRQLKTQLAQIRQENADLRRGIGITVLIDGKAVLTGAGPLPDVAASPVAAMQSPTMSPTAMPAFATSPASMHDRQSPSGPAAATIPSNLFQQGNTPKPYPPPAPQNPPARDGQSNQRGAGYRDFFLD